MLAKIVTIKSGETFPSHHRRRRVESVKICDLNIRTVGILTAGIQKRNGGSGSRLVLGGARGYPDKTEQAIRRQLHADAGIDERRPITLEASDDLLLLGRLVDADEDEAELVSIDSLPLPRQTA